MNFAYAVCCRRMYPFLALISLAIVFIYFIAFTDNTGKDNLPTKFVQTVIPTPKRIRQYTIG